MSGYKYVFVKYIRNPYGGIDDEFKDILYEELNNGSMYFIVCQKKTISGYSKEYYCHVSLNAGFELKLGALSMFSYTESFSNVDEASAHVEKLLKECNCVVIDEGMMVYS
jgi:hypothetical protein